MIDGDGPSGLPDGQEADLSQRVKTRIKGFLFLPLERGNLSEVNQHVLDVLVGNGYTFRVCDEVEDGAEAVIDG